MQTSIIEPKQLPLYAYWDGAFTEAELDRIIELGSAQGLEEALTNALGKDGGEKLKPSTRTCKLNWMDYNTEHAWIFERLQSVFLKLNSQFYNYILDRFEPFQFTSYSSDRQEFYGKHMDCSFGINCQSTSRKLSVTLQLSDGADYTGGDLIFHPGIEPVVAPKKRGMIVLFPSFIVHEVTPVITGHRYSLVTWAHGPLFR